MQSKSTLMSASKVNPSHVFAAAKATGVESVLSFSAEGTALIDKAPVADARLDGLATLTGYTGSVTGTDLRLMAIEHVNRRATGSREYGVVVENLNHRRKVWTTSGMVPLDGLSQDLVRVGGVYPFSMTKNGFAVIDPRDELFLGKGQDVNRIVGRVPPFAFDAVWRCIRDREAEATVLRRQQQEEAHADGLVAALRLPGRTIQLGSF